MRLKSYAAALVAVAALAATPWPAAGQERPGKLQIVRGSMVETYAAKPAGALPVVLRGEVPREVERERTPSPANWIMAGGGRGVWFYNAGDERLVTCWRELSYYVGEYRIYCARRTLTLY
jgi:hypothetical protein